MQNNPVTLPLKLRVYVSGGKSSVDGLYWLNVISDTGRTNQIPFASYKLAMATQRAIRSAWKTFFKGK